MILTRQNLTWSACDALAADGRKPSIGLVRDWTLATGGAKKGSDGDVQKDINAWFGDLLKLKKDKSIADLPDPVAALARDFWRLAVDAANESIAHERTKLDAEKTEMEKLIDLAQEDTVAAVEIANLLKGKIAIANEAIGGRDQTIGRLESVVLEQQKQIESRNDRIEAQAANIARLGEEGAILLVEMEANRKHGLLQIDQARAALRQYKAESVKTTEAAHFALEQRRQTTSALETELAEVRGRMSALEESMESGKQRIASLETELSSTRLLQSVTQSKLPQRSVGAKAGTMASTRRRKK
ncbi:MAG: DNA-binding protein [Herminiimonas sp.]|nr:DNA-binding protein [Herminiimonas sp.]